MDKLNRMWNWQYRTHPYMRDFVELGYTYCNGEALVYADQYYTTTNILRRAPDGHRNVDKVYASGLLMRADIGGVSVYAPVVMGDWRNTILTEQTLVDSAALNLMDAMTCAIRLSRSCLEYVPMFVRMLRYIMSLPISSKGRATLMASILRREVLGGMTVAGRRNLSVAVSGIAIPEKFTLHDWLRNSLNEVHRMGQV